jgi:hypothetical protein
MVTIPLKVSDELAQRLMPWRDQLPRIIERGLRGLETEAPPPVSKSVILAALQSTGLVTIPDPAARTRARIRHTPLKAGGPPASELIIAERSSP